jgi:hypothetical protein
MKLRHIENPGWDLIKDLGWGTWTTDYNMIGRYMYKSVDLTTIQKLRMFVTQQVARLYTLVEVYEQTSRPLQVGSDDGMADLLHHIVGLGEEEYNRVIKKPILIERRYKAEYGSKEGYKESFIYCFHVPEDMWKEVNGRQV